MTSLYLTTAVQVVPSAAEPTRWRLAGTAGASSRACNKNTAAGPTAPLLVTDSATAGLDGASLGWYSDPLAAVTIAGQIVASLWGVESAATANAAPCIGVYRTDVSGIVLATIVDPATAGSQGGLELATTAGAKTCTIAAATVTDTSLNAGERLKVTLCVDDAADQGGSGSMASAQNARLFVNGPTGSAGQSQITFTETIISAGSGLVFPATAGRAVNLGREAPRVISGNLGKERQRHGPRGSRVPHHRGRVGDPADGQPVLPRHR